jgi:two-component system sensor histidine kinase SenX3
MIALSRAQDGPDPSVFDYVDVSKIVETALGLLWEAAEAKKVKLRYAKRNSGIVYGDFRALVTAVENLISNAVHYSPLGAKVLVTTRVDVADGVAIISVIDQGIGIALEERERIFERFYRTDEARAHRSGGTGLGLAIVRNTALSHGGSVSVASKPQHGSTFALTLPLADVESGAGGGAEGSEA